MLQSLLKFPFVELFYASLRQLRLALRVSICLPVALLHRRTDWSAWSRSLFVRGPGLNGLRDRS